jgi:MFS family permease
VASGISNLGDGLSVVAYPWLASALTRNPVAIAGLGIASRLPWLLFTLPAGVITDRHDRRRLVFTMDALRFLLTIAIAIVILAGEGSLNDPADIADGIASTPANAPLALVGLYAAALTLGFAEVLRDNSAQTLMPSIVRQDQLERANGRLMAVEMVTNGFVGPPLAGLLLAVSFSLPFFVDAGTFAVAAGLIFFISGEFLPKGQAKPFEAKAPSSFKTDIAEGIRWLRSTPLLWSMAIALGITNGLWTAALAAEVLFVQEVLGLGAAAFGLLGIAGAFGGIAGSVAASRLSERFGPGTLLLSALGIFGLSSLLIGAFPSVGLVFGVFVVFGFFSAIWNVITVALRQSLIPDRLLGRVNSVYRFFGWGGMPIGSLIGGTLVLVVDAFASRNLALRSPLLFAGVGNLLLLAWAWSRLNNHEIEKAKARGVDKKIAADAGLNEDNTDGDNFDE